jgi:hypothetical protein
MSGWDCRHLDGQFFFKKRSKVDAEIEKRQESWQESDPDEPQAVGAEGGEAVLRPADTRAGMAAPPPLFADGIETAPPEIAEPGAALPPEVQSAEESELAEGEGAEPDEPVMKRKTHKYRLVYKSDFSKPPGWDEECSNKVKVFREDGYYHIIVQAVKHMVYCNPPIVMKNFLAQVDYQFVGEIEENSMCGIIFGVRDVEAIHSWCEIVVNKHGWFSVQGKRKTEHKMIVDWEETKHIKQGDKVNTLTAAKVGREIAVWINGQDVAAVGDDWITPGYVGIFVCTSPTESATHVRFRNFELQAIE